MQGLRFSAFLKYGLFAILSTCSFSLLSSYSHISTFKKYIIVIDAGHGGKDIGTSGHNLIEKDATLILAKELGQQLTKNNSNIEIKYTREIDIFLPVHRRVGIANEYNADLFISIHCNSISAQSPNGIETYVLGIQNNSENLQTVKRENQAILHEADFHQNYDGFDPNSPSGHIYLSAIQNQYINEGILVAHEIQIQFSDKNIMRDRGVKQAGFVVLKKATMPAILVEVGFLSNEHDEAKLINDNSRKKIISNISDGINIYISTIQNIDNQVVIHKNEAAPIEYKPIKMSPIVNNEMTQYNVMLASSCNGVIPDLRGMIVLKMEVLEEKINKKYLYTIGTFSTLTSAVEAQNNARKNGFKGAYVIKAASKVKMQSKNNDVRIKFEGVN
ncbi:MAG: N-acetylmuramoyl-L-alanine amidase [Saprospiraceae bacterium]